MSRNLIKVEIKVDTNLSFETVKRVVEEKVEEIAQSLDGIWNLTIEQDEDGISTQLSNELRSQGTRYPSPSEWNRLSPIRRVTQSPFSTCDRGFIDCEGHSPLSRNEARWLWKFDGEDIENIQEKASVLPISPKPIKKQRRDFTPLLFGQTEENAERGRTKEHGDQNSKGAIRGFARDMGLINSRMPSLTCSEEMIDEDTDDYLMPNFKMQPKIFANQIQQLLEDDDISNKSGY